MLKLYKEAGGMVDFTQEELLFSAFHHDLGKLGERGNMAYKIQESEWHRKNRGDVYTWNEVDPERAKRFIEAARSA